MSKLDSDSTARLLALLRNDRDSRYVLNKLRSWERCDDCCQTRGMYFLPEFFGDVMSVRLPYGRYSCINHSYNEPEVTYFYLKARSRRL